MATETPSANAKGSNAPLATDFIPPSAWLSGQVSPEGGQPSTAGGSTGPRSFYHVSSGPSSRPSAHSSVGDSKRFWSQWETSTVEHILDRMFEDPHPMTPILMVQIWQLVGQAEGGLTPLDTNRVMYTLDQIKSESESTKTDIEPSQRLTKLDDASVATMQDMALRWSVSVAALTPPLGDIRLSFEDVPYRRHKAFARVVGHLSRPQYRDEQDIDELAVMQALFRLAFGRPELLFKIQKDDNEYPMLLDYMAEQFEARFGAEKAVGAQCEQREDMPDPQLAENVYQVARKMSEMSSSASETSSLDHLYRWEMATWNRRLGQLG